MAAQFLLLQTFDELHKASRLLAKTFEQFGAFQPAMVIQQMSDSRQKDAFGKNVGIAIAKKLLKLLDGSQRAPDARRDACETGRTPLEALREFQHINEILEHAGNAAVVFRRDDMQPGRLQNRVGKGLKGFWLFGVRTRRKNFRWQLREVEHAQRHF